MDTPSIRAVSLRDGHKSLQSVCCARTISSLSAGHPAGDRVKPNLHVPIQSIAQPEAQRHRKSKRKPQAAAQEHQTPQLVDGPVKKKEKRNPSDEAGDGGRQPPRSAGKARSAPARNALSPSPSEERTKKKKKKNELRDKQALLRQGLTADVTNAISRTEQKESRMETKPRKVHASEWGAAGSAAGLGPESIRQSLPVRKVDPEEAKAPKQAESGSATDVNNADSMPGIPGASTSAATWRELDKRTDVKRGRFSQTEKEALLEAIKVLFKAYQG